MGRLLFLFTLCAVAIVITQCEGKESPLTVFVNRMILNLRSSKIAKSSFSAEYYYGEGDSVDVFCGMKRNKCKSLSMNYNYADNLSDKFKNAVRNSEFGAGFRAKLHSEHNLTYVRCACTHKRGERILVEVKFILNNFENSMTLKINDLILRPPSGNVENFDVVYIYDENEIIHVNFERNGRVAKKMNIRNKAIFLDNVNVDQGSTTDEINNVIDLRFKVRKERKVQVNLNCGATPHGEKYNKEKVNVKFKASDEFIDHNPLYLQGLVEKNIVMTVYNYRNLEIVYYKFDDGDKLSLNCTSPLSTKTLVFNELSYSESNNTNVCKDINLGPHYNNTEINCILKNGIKEFITLRKIRVVLHRRNNIVQTTKTRTETITNNGTTTSTIPPLPEVISTVVLPDNVTNSASTGSYNELTTTSIAPYTGQESTSIAPYNEITPTSIAPYNKITISSIVPHYENATSSMEPHIETTTISIPPIDMTAISISIQNNTVVKYNVTTRRSRNDTYSRKLWSKTPKQEQQIKPSTSPPKTKPSTGTVVSKAKLTTGTVPKMKITKKTSPKTNDMPRNVIAPSRSTNQIEAPTTVLEDQHHTKLWQAAAGIAICLLVICLTTIVYKKIKHRLKFQERPHDDGYANLSNQRNACPAPNNHHNGSHTYAVPTDQKNDTATYSVPYTSEGFYAKPTPKSKKISRINNHERTYANFKFNPTSNLNRSEKIKADTLQKESHTVEEMYAKAIPKSQRLSENYKNDLYANLEYKKNKIETLKTVKPDLSKKNISYKTEHVYTKAKPKNKRAAKNYDNIYQNSDNTETMEITNNTATYSVVNRPNDKYAGPTPKTKNELTIYAEIDLKCKPIPRNDLRNIDNSNYCEIIDNNHMKVKDVRGNNKFYSNEFEGSQYINCFNKEYVEPTYCEANQKPKYK